jgi:hypothetical protein
MQASVRTHLDQFREHFVGRVPPGAEQDPIGAMALEIADFDEERRVLAVAEPLADLISNRVRVEAH